jgi:hypothetical protein
MDRALPKLLKIIQGASQSHYERDDIGQMFGVKSRTAASLLGLMTTVTIGNKVLVPREELLEFLRMFAPVENRIATLEGHKTRVQQRKAEAKQREA